MSDAQAHTIECPSPSALEAFATGGLDTSGAIASHIRVCKVCAVYVDDTRENARFLAGVVPERSFRAPAQEIPRTSNISPGYSIVREIARGGQGIVYEGIQIDTKRRVALKMLHHGEVGAHTGKHQLRLEREAEIAAMLRHPGIAAIYESIATDDGGRMLVMEYVDGVRLDEWLLLAGKPRSMTREGLRERLLVMLRVCEAVEHAHQQGVIHRDLKPGNVMVRSAMTTRDHAGESTHVGGPVPCLLDFGIARSSTRDMLDPLYTQTGAFVGTLAYTSPEQVSGNPDRVGTRSDVYALGVLLHEVVFGRRPYETDGPLETVIARITLSDPVRVSGVPGELWTIISKALSKDVTRRYQSAGQLGKDIANYLAGEAIDARRDSAMYVLRKTLWLRKGLVAVALAAVIGIVVFGVFMAWQAGRLRVERNAKTLALREQGVTFGRALTLTGDTLGAMQYLGAEAGHLSNASSTPFESVDPVVRRAAWGLVEALAHDTRVSTVDSLANIQSPDQPGMQPAALTLDNDRLMLVRSNGIVQSWDASTGEVSSPTRLSPTFVPQSDEYVRLSGDTTIAVAWTDASLRVIDMVMGVELARAQLQGGSIVDGSVSPDSQKFLATMSDGSLSVWSMSLEHLYRFSPAEKNGLRVRRPVFTPDMQYSIVATDRWCIESISRLASPMEVVEGNMAIRLSRFVSQSRVVFHSIWPAPNSSFAVAVHPDLLFVFRPDNVQRRTEDVQTRLFRSDGQWADAVAFSGDSSAMFAATIDRHVAMWKTNGLLLAGSEPKQGPEPEVVTGQLYGDCVLLAADARGTRLSALDHRGFLTTFEIETTWKRTIDPWDRVSNVTPGSVSAVKWNHGTVVVAGRDSARVRVVDPHGLESTRSVRAHESGSERNVTSIAIHPKLPGRFATVGRDGTCVLWDGAGAQAEIIKSLQCPGAANDIAWSPDGTWIAVACDGDSPVVVFRDLESQSPASIQIHIPDVVGGTHLAISSDGADIAVLTEPSQTRALAPTLVLVDAIEHVVRSTAHQIESPTALAYSIQGDTLLVGTDDARIATCNAKTLVVTQLGPVLIARIREIVPDIDGSTVFAALDSADLFVLDAHTGRDLARLPGESGVGWKLTSLDAHEDTIVTGHMNSKITLWDIKRLKRYARASVDHRDPASIDIAPDKSASLRPD